MGIDVNEMRERGLNPGKNSIGSDGLVETSGGSTFDPKAQNEVIVQWQSMVQRKLRGNANVFRKGKDGTISRPGRSEKRLSDSIITKNKLNFGVIGSVSFVFERHGVFVHKGVGRGYNIKNGMVVRAVLDLKKLLKNKNLTTNQKISIRGESKLIKRKPYDWFNVTMDQELPELANKIANINADAVLNATRIMIK